MENEHEEHPVADRTPETPRPDDAPVPNHHAQEHDDSLRQMVERLEEQVRGLSEQVAALAPVPTDEAPVSKPWTHRTFG